MLLWINQSEDSRVQTQLIPRLPIWGFLLLVSDQHSFVQLFGGLLAFCLFFRHAATLLLERGSNLRLPFRMTLRSVVLGLSAFHWPQLAWLSCKAVGLVGGTVDYSRLLYLCIDDENT